MAECPFCKGLNTKREGDMVWSCAMCALQAQAAVGLVADEAIARLKAQLALYQACLQEADSVVDKVRRGIYDCTAHYLALRSKLPTSPESKE